MVHDYRGSGSRESIADFSGSYKVQSKDRIKFVCNDDGKITTAYITNVEAGKVTSVTASKVTITGVGAISLEDNDVYEDIAKDDVVVYTKFYDTDKDKAFFTVTKAEAVEGELTGYKKTSDEVDGSGNFVDNTNKFDNLVVDGKTYKINDKELKNLTDDAIVTPEPSDVGSTVRVYLVDGFAAAAQTIDKTGGNYAIVTEVSDNSNGIGSTMNPLKITVLLADGTEQTVTIHKESTWNGSQKITEYKTTPGAQEGLFANADKTTKNAVLIEYTSVANGSIRIKTIFDPAGKQTATRARLWDKDAKALDFGAKTYVAAADAVLFVGVDDKLDNGAEGSDGTHVETRSEERRVGKEC